MSYANRIVRLPTSRAQQLAQWFVVAGLAFSLGLAASVLRREAAATQAVAVAAPAGSQARGGEAAAARGAYHAGWQLYDGGWAGGPAPAAGAVPQAAR